MYMYNNYFIYIDVHVHSNQRTDISSTTCKNKIEIYAISWVVKLELVLYNYIIIKLSNIVYECLYF